MSAPRSASGAETAPAPPAPPWHVLDRAEVEARLHTSAAGLDPAEVEARLAQHGPNELEEEPPPSTLRLLLHQFQSPLIYILLVAAAITVLLAEYVDAAVIAAVLALNAAIGFTQERRAERSVRALMRLLTPQARVVRGGREWEVESRTLVPGDLVLLESGSRVPADLRIVSRIALQVDESLLTGESVPVVKKAARLDDPEVGHADRMNMAHAGTVVTTGRGRGYVVATGGASVLGAIAAQVRGRERAETPLQQRMTRFAHLVGVVVAVGAVVVFAMGVARGESPAAMFMVAVAMAVAVVPEGLPVVFTITLALGVRRMARRNAIVRRLPAVETLGSTTVIGSDKTGTLTENRMTVQRIWAGGRTFTVVEAGRPGNHGALLEGEEVTAVAAHQPLYLTLLAGVLTNEAQIARTEQGYESRGDPTEAALLIAASRLGIEPEEARAGHPVYAEIPFEPERQYSASVREFRGGHAVFVKGAPERLLAMSERMATEAGDAPVDPDAVQKAAREVASGGLRVLGMAYRVLSHPPAGPDDVPEPGGLTFLGLQGSKDPPRTGVREAIAGCQAAGIRVVMITGDHPATARAIGTEMGIAGRDAEVLTGADLAAMDEPALRGRVRDVALYARVAPEHKLRVVQALQGHGEVVAVTGDGVNDAPALRAANIGIAMGQSGTDVAREAADMVLTDDNFVTIYAAVEEGRVTFDNVRKVTFFLVSTGAAALLAILAALLFRWPLPFVPAQLLWLNLVTKGLQDVALAFEPGEPGVLERPPRRPEEGVISALLWERTAVVGVVMAAGTLVLFQRALEATGDLGLAQTVALTTMVVFQMFHVGNSRSEYRSVFQLSPVSNPFLFAATAAALGVHVVALHVPWSQFVLRVQPLGLATWVDILVAATTILVAIELHKLVRRPASRGGRRG
jgi:magnesium-transporting ATPase (P-type)